jgi:hypothetical protein
MSKPKDPVEWTIMFYFASDNPLASSIVSQLKALKDAGGHQQTNVIAYFDPQPKNMPSHVFEVNLVEKLKGKREHPKLSQVVFEGNDPFIRNLVFDRLWAEKDEETKEKIRQYFHKGYHIEYDSPTVPEELVEEQSPQVSLSKFLEFCRTEYPARHYILIILGHGVVVGNDIFLLDDNIPDDDEGGTDDGSEPTPPDPSQKPLVKKPARNSLTLKDLGVELRKFKDNIGSKSRFELLGLHSCSMSGLEVAYELQGTAQYLLASQGPAFVGSWPYKQILLRVFNDLRRPSQKGAAKLKERLIKIFQYCIQNSYDYLLAGYSFDMALCDLSKLDGVSAPLEELASALIAGLKMKDKSANDKRVKDVIKGLILLAHWDAQSFWQEQYTDLYDFCFRLNDRIQRQPEKKHPALSRISAACRDMMRALKRGRQGDDNGVVVRSEFIGPAFQYSHGLSVFFPWSAPEDRKFLKRYRDYQISQTKVFGKGSRWIDFLDTYFVETMRALHAQEGDKLDSPVGKPSLETQLLDVLQSISNTITGVSEQLGDPSSDPPKGPGNPLGSDPKGPGNPTGDSCTCPSIKNYPSSVVPLGPNLAEEADEQFR